MFHRGPWPQHHLKKKAISLPFHAHMYSMIAPTWHGKVMDVRTRTTAVGQHGKARRIKINRKYTSETIFVSTHLQYIIPPKHSTAQGGIAARFESPCLAAHHHTKRRLRATHQPVHTSRYRSRKK